MDYIFRQTEGDAQEHLDGLYEEDSPLQLRSAEAMFLHLASCYEQIDERADARDSYRRCIQGSSERFRDFKGRFTSLANRARIDPDTQLEDLFHKSRADLQFPLLAERRSWRTLEEAARKLDNVDKELESFRRRTQQRTRALHPLGTAAPKGILPLTAARVTTPAPVRRLTLPLAPQRTSSSVKCYNCGEPGHIRTECPQPKQERTIQQFEEDSQPIAGAEYADEEDEEDSLEESGNEAA